MEDFQRARGGFQRAWGTLPRGGSFGRVVDFRPCGGYFARVVNLKCVNRRGSWEADPEESLQRDLPPAKSNCQTIFRFLGVSLSPFANFFGSCPPAKSNCQTFFRFLGVSLSPFANFFQDLPPC